MLGVRVKGLGGGLGGEIREGLNPLLTLLYVSRHTQPIKFILQINKLTNIIFFLDSHLLWSVEFAPGLLSQMHFLRNHMCDYTPVTIILSFHSPDIIFMKEGNNLCFYVLKFTNTILKACSIFNNNTAVKGLSYMFH